MSGIYVMAWIYLGRKSPALLSVSIVVLWKLLQEIITELADG
jgi:hypothetical protein